MSLNLVPPALLSGNVGQMIEVPTISGGESQLDIDGLIDFKLIQLFGWMLPTNDNPNLWARTSADGISFDGTAGDYHYQYFRTYKTFITDPGTANEESNADEQSDKIWLSACSVGNGATEPIRFSYTIFNADGQYPYFIGETGNNRELNYLVRSEIAAQRFDTANIESLRLFFEHSVDGASTIAAGDVSAWGLLR